MLAEPTTKVSSSDVARLREGAMLAQIMAMRQATLEAGIDDAARQSILDVLDQSCQRLLEKVGILSRDPRPFEERLGVMKSALSDANNELRTAARSHDLATRPSLTHVMMEFKALSESKERVLTGYKTLNLTEEQRGTVEAEIERFGAELRDAQNHDDIPESEKRMVAILRVRTAIRNVLSEEQRAIRDKWLDDRLLEEQRRSITVSPVGPRPQAVPPRPPAPR
jgi:hypothetical protein